MGVGRVVGPGVSGTGKGESPGGVKGGVEGGGQAEKSKWGTFRVKGRRVRLGEGIHLPQQKI